jgi:type I restriction enzyme S subunit
VKTPTARVGELALNESGAFKIGPFGSSLKKTELVETGIPVAGIENVLTNNFVKVFRRFITARKFEELSDYEILPDDVLVTTMGTIGRAASAPHDVGRVIFDSHLFRMRVDTSRVFPAYLCYALNSDLVASQLARMARGAIMDGLNTTILRECSIPLPAMSEQQRIAGRLEQADRLVRTRCYALELTDTFLPAAFVNLFGDPEKNPLGLSESELGELCEEVLDCSHSTPIYTAIQTPHPCVRSSDIQKGYLDFSEAKYVSPCEYQKRIARGKPMPGDVIYCREGARFGNAGRIIDKTEICLGQRTMLFRANSKVAVGEFIWAFLSSRGAYRQATRALDGSASPHVNVGEIVTFRVPVPPLSLQQRFASMCKRVDHLRAVQREALRQTEHLFTSLLHSAFSG